MTGTSKLNPTRVILPILVCVCMIPSNLTGPSLSAYSQPQGRLSLGEIKSQIPVLSDRALSLTIRRRGINFTITQQIIADLRAAGAGTETIRVLGGFIKKDPPVPPAKPAGEDQVPQRNPEVISFRGDSLRFSTKFDLAATMRMGHSEDAFIGKSTYISFYYPVFTKVTDTRDTLMTIVELDQVKPTDLKPIGNYREFISRGLKRSVFSYDEIIKLRSISLGSAGTFSINASRGVFDGSDSGLEMGLDKIASTKSTTDILSLCRGTIGISPKFNIAAVLLVDHGQQFNNNFTIRFFYSPTNALISEPNALLSETDSIFEHKERGWPDQQNGPIRDVNLEGAGKFRIAVKDIYTYTQVEKFLLGVTLHIEKL
jgi:hypothetical protein